METLKLMLGTADMGDTVDMVDTADMVEADTVEVDMVEKTNVVGTAAITVTVTIIAAVMQVRPKLKPSLTTEDGSTQNK